MSKNSLITKIAYNTLICIFIGLVWLPLLGYFFGDDTSDDLGEKRVLAQCPVLGVDPIETIPEKFETFFKDHFGFRSKLIRGHNWIKYNLLKGSSIGDVLIGKDEWLFLTESEIIPDYLGEKPFTSKELDCWKTTLEQRKNWLAEHGIRYLFVIAPNKASIYSEMLPDHIYRNKGLTRMDQLTDYLSKTSTVEFIDVRDILRKAKDTMIVYHPQDTHWNHLGAFLVYQEICKHLTKWFPDIQSWSIEDFTITEEKIVGDLGTMLGIGEELALECKVLLPRRLRNAYQVNLKLPAQYDWPRHIVPDKQIALENKNANHRLLFFHDSFGNHGGLQQYISEHFSRSAFVPASPDSDSLALMVEQEHPDVVIEEMVERELKNVPSLNK